MRFSVVLAATAVACCAVGAAGCGFVTHNLVAHRAAQHMFQFDDMPEYGRILRENVDAMQGGAPFPDYLYSCGNHDAAEDAHWAPFQVAAVKYVRSLPRPWSKQDERLVAFLMGLVSHYIADLNWHGLGGVPFGRGFIRTMGGVNYNCSGSLCNDAHGAADTGGEFMAAAMADLTFFHPRTWYVPIDDMINIWKLYGDDGIQHDQLSNCMSIFYLGSFVIKNFGKLVHHMFTAPSPFMEESYFEHPIGGIDDMAVWTGWMMKRFAGWIEHGPPPKPYPGLLRANAAANASAPASALLDESVVQDIERWAAHRHHGVSAPMQRFYDALRPVLAEHPELVHARRDGKGVVLEAPPLHSLLRASVLPRVARAIAELFSNDVTGSPVTNALVTSAAFVEDTFRSSVTQGASGVSRFLDNLVDQMNQYLLPGAPTPLLRVEGRGYFQYTGNALAVGDFAGDGSQTLAVGMPGASKRDDPQRGAVALVSLSAAPAAAAATPAATRTIAVELDAAGEATAGTTAAGVTVVPSPEMYARLGWAVAALDWDLDGVQDLVAAAPSAGWQEQVPRQPDFPYQGKVFVHFGRRGTGVAAAADVVLVMDGDGAAEDAMLGFKLSTGDVDGDGRADLLLGAPLANTQAEGVQAGRLFVLLSSASRRPAAGASGMQSVRVLDAASAEAHGSGAFEWFGYHASTARVEGVDAPLLLVGAPTFRYASRSATLGRLYALQWRGGKLTTLFTITGETVMDKFGLAAAVGTPEAGSGPVLAVSAPSATPTQNAAQRGGRVWLFELTPALWAACSQGPDCAPDWRPSQLQTRAQLVGNQAEGRLGWSMVFADFNGDGACDLALGEPHASSLAAGTQSGAVLVWRGATAADVAAGRVVLRGTITRPHATAAWMAGGQAASARFGTALLAADVDGDGRAELIVSAPRDGGAEKMSGSVHVYSHMLR